MTYGELFDAIQNNWMPRSRRLLEMSNNSSIPNEKRERAFLLSQKMLLRSANGLKICAAINNKSSRKFPPGGYTAPDSGEGEFVISKPKK